MEKIEMEKMISRLMVDKEKVKDFIQQTLTPILHFVGNTVEFFTKKLGEMLPQEKMIRRLMVDKEKVKDFIQQTLTLIPHFFGNTVEFFTKKLDEMLPQETRDETLKLVLPILLILLLLYCCCRCSYRCFFGVSRKMMRAPGRKGTLMPRGTFVANPRGYFRNLRGKDSD